MSSLHLTPLNRQVSATIEVPGSKSHTNRALIMAALTKGSVSLKNPLYADDTYAMIECLQTLGLHLEKTENLLIVHDDISTLKAKEISLFARDSGTTLRFLLPLLCMTPGTKIIWGNQRLSERPIHDLVEGLQSLGAIIEYCEEEKKLPIKISSSTLSQPMIHLKSNLSSQFCSAILLIAPLLGELTIHLTTPLISKPYVDMTLSCMKDARIQVTSEQEGYYFIPKGQAYQKKEYVIEGDYSSAGYFFALAALTQSKITVENLNPLSAQPDKKFLTILQKMGNEVSFEKTKVSIQGKRVLPIEVNMEDCPDQIMTLAVIAAFAKGKTQISGVRSLRFKETDRMRALTQELSKMGIQTDAFHDTLVIHGGSAHSAEIDTYNDHRMAMSFAIAGMRLPGMSIRNPEVVNKTFPTFWQVLRSLV